MKVCLWDKLQTVFKQNESMFIEKIANSDLKKNETVFMGQGANRV